MKVKSVEVAYHEELIEVGLIRVLPRLLEYGLYHIVPIGVKHQVFKDLSILHKVVEEQDLRLWTVGAADRAFNNVRGDLLGAVVT